MTALLAPTPTVDLARLRGKARAIRREILRMVHAGQSGHPGGSLGVADLVTALYYAVLRHDPQNPRWAQRDRFILSKGHCSPVIYAVLADCGYFPPGDLATFRRPGSHLQGHPCSAKTPGIEASTGTLGLGLSTACGMALGGMLRGGSHYYYALCGDGEQQEGQIWEAAMFANKYHLSNLIAFTDRNRLQTDGDTEDVMPLDPLPEKWRAFGWHSWEIDGHDFTQILAAVARAKREHDGRPTMIIANTTKGKGVSFMEGAAAWHSGPPSDAQLALALEELAHD
ncbi:MAG: transketolase [Verrucomicrobia bacterium]|nr:transketolase [Verrucomicrobiota bacterium]